MFSLLRGLGHILAASWRALYNAAKVPGFVLVMLEFLAGLSFLFSRALDLVSFYAYQLPESFQLPAMIVATLVFTLLNFAGLSAVGWLLAPERKRSNQAEDEEDYEGQLETV